MTMLKLALPRAPRIPRCPRCDASEGIREIVYGEPDAVTLARHREGQVELGGCLIEIDDNGRLGPKWSCEQCGHRWPSTGRSGYTFQVRGLNGCMGISNWTPEGHYVRFEHALQEVRSSFHFLHSAYEIRIIGPKGGVRFHRAQKPVGPLPG
jgi:hypothetical protein